MTGIALKYEILLREIAIVISISSRPSIYPESHSLSMLTAFLSPMKRCSMYCYRKTIVHEHCLDSVPLHIVQLNLSGFQWDLRMLTTSLLQHSPPQSTPLVDGSCDT